MTGAGFVVLRLTVGSVMVIHGLPKIENYEEMGETWHENWGFPRWSALLAGATQVAGGTGLVAGVYSRWSALLLLVNMLVATYAAAVKNREPFLGVKSKGWDINLVLLGALLSIVVGGGGRWTLLETGQHKAR